MFVLWGRSVTSSPLWLYYVIRSPSIQETSWISNKCPTKPDSLSLRGFELKRGSCIMLRVAAVTGCHAPQEFNSSEAQTTETLQQAAFSLLQFIFLFLKFTLFELRWDSCAFSLHGNVNTFVIISFIYERFSVHTHKKMEHGVEGRQRKDHFHLDRRWSVEVSVVVFESVCFSAVLYLILIISCRHCRKNTQRDTKKCKMCQLICAHVIVQVFMGSWTFQLLFQEVQQRSGCRKGWGIACFYQYLPYAHILD